MTVGIGLADNATVDTSKLTAAITAANSKAGNAVAGSDIDQYPQSAINAFNAAIATAQKVANDASATQTEVNQAVTNLKAAETKFNAAKITTVNKAALTTAITAASAKSEDAVAGSDIDQYPQSAINAFNAAIATAQVVANDASATLDEVNQAVNDLKAAEKAFDAAKITTGDVTVRSSVTNLKETDTGPGWINWGWVNPTDADFSHVMVYMNGTFVTNTSDRSINSYNVTGLSEGVTYTIGIRTVDISGNISSTWVNDSATTVQLPRVYSLSGTNITTSSITLIWEASNDTTRVQISRDDVIIGNASGSTSYVDSNLSGGTTYSYTLVPYDLDGLKGKAVSISLKTSSHSSGGGEGSSTTKSGSSGGGGGGSLEDFANIALKDVDSEYLRANANATYEFTDPGNDIRSISFYSLKNSGEITSTIEVLNNRSKLVNSSPEGLVYEYINIWVGKAGFATSDNMHDARVRFKVNSSWIQSMGVTPTDVRLQRYNGTAWEVLPTTLVSDTMDYTVFESQVPGFSPFAITAEKAFASPVNSDTDTKPAQAAVVSIEQTQPEKSGIWTFLKALFVVEVFAVGYEYRRRRKK